ncbi:MAG: redoxin domain-containing protein [Chloroflexota bacterium]
MRQYPLKGQIAPTFELIADDQSQIHLTDLKNENGTLLIFVYGTYCPTCLHTYMRLAEDRKQFESSGVNIAVISLDKWHQSNVFKLSMGRKMPFPILSDEDGDIHKAYHTYNNSFTAVHITADGTVTSGIQANEYPGTKRVLSLLDGKNAIA